MSWTVTDTDNDDGTLKPAGAPNTGGAGDTTLRVFCVVGTETGHIRSVVRLTTAADIILVTGTFAHTMISLDVDGVAANDSDVSTRGSSTSTSAANTSYSELIYLPTIGYHFFQQMERTTVSTPGSALVGGRGGIIGWVLG